MVFGILTHSTTASARAWPINEALRTCATMLWTANWRMSHCLEMTRSLAHALVAIMAIAARCKFGDVDGDGVRMMTSMAAVFMVPTRPVIMA